MSADGSFFDRIKKRLHGPSKADDSLATENIQIVRGFANFHTSEHWNLWAPPPFLDQHPVSNELKIFPELFVRQLERDFGYTIFPARQSYDGERLDLVLDPASQGGAHTGTIFGPLGASISPDSVYNDYAGEVGFWYRLLSLHETINVWTGALAQGWIWADGSELWGGASPFPNMADFVILDEIGYKRSASSQRERMSGDSSVRVFYDIYRRHAWQPYQSLFSFVRQNNIRDWHSFSEPLRTAITVLVLSRSAGEDYLQDFQDAGIRVTQEAYARAQSMFRV